MLRQRTALLMSIAVGVALQIGTWQATGVREAWQDATYWTVGLPLAALAAACIGYLGVGTAWTGTILIVPAQVVTMVAKNGGLANLSLLPLALAIPMGLPFVLIAYVTSRLRSRRV